MRFWFKRMKNFILDFEITSKDAIETFRQLIDTTYDLFTGPLWKVRLVLSNVEEKTGQYSAVLIFCIQHSITDGTSNMHICREFVSILNKIIKGQKVEPKAIPLAPIIDSSVNIGSRITFLAKYLWRKLVSMIVDNYYQETSFNGALPVPKTKEATVKVLFDDFTKTETDKLIAMCREAKITVNSFVTTVTNFALLRTAQSRSGKSLEKKSISVGHCVNMRRYFENQEQAYTTGCHLSFLDHKIKISLADIKDFWATAKRIHRDIRNKLEVQKLPLNIVPIIQSGRLFLLTNNFLIQKGFKNITACHYGTTNMGNLKDLLPEPKEDDNIEITYILRSVSNQITINPFTLSFHTFRDRFMISIDYYTNKMEEEVAQELFATLSQYIRDIINLNTIEG